MILCIGEIDCREGFLVALERDYYDSIEEAMNHTIKSFVRNLQTICEHRQLKVSSNVIIITIMIIIIMVIMITIDLYPSSTSSLK